MKRKAITLCLSLFLLMAAVFQPFAAEELRGVRAENDTRDEASLAPRKAPQAKHEPIGNAHSAENIAQSAWYTKVIDFTGYNGKSVEGELSFNISPNADMNREYDFYDRQTDPMDPTFVKKIKIVPGKIGYSYNVPYSSEDFPDPIFNQMALESAPQNGDSLPLFNYALLHEWGRMVSSGPESGTQKVNVGKITRAMFDDDRSYYEALNQYVVTWQNDPEHAVMGWICYTDRENISSLDCRIGGTGCKNLDEWYNFRDGTMNYYDLFGLYNNPLVKYSLALITRPIAISMNKDAGGNILSIEKPLLPSARAFDFLKLHEDDWSISADDDEGNDLIYRYYLTENPQKGPELIGERASLILDVVGPYPHGNIFIFRSAEEADAFYSTRIAELEKTTGYIELDNHEDYRYGFVLGQSKRIQVVNSIPKTRLAVSAVWDDEDDKNARRPDQVEVYLLADGKETGEHLTLTAASGWQGAFENISLYRYMVAEDKTITETPIQYSIQESAVPHYTTSAETFEDKTARLSFRYANDIRSLDVNMSWDDAANKAQKRPAKAMMFLLKNGHVIDRRELSAAEDWKTNYAELPRNDEKGKEIDYSVLSEQIKDYVSTYDEFHITQQWKPDDSCGPCPSGKPADPAKPSNPSNPCQPSSPCNPTTPCKPSYSCKPSTPCQPSNPCQSGTILSPCKPRSSNSLRQTNGQAAASSASKTTGRVVNGSKAPTSAGMLPVTADGSFVNVLYAALLLILAAVVTALRYEMKRRKEN